MWAAFGVAHPTPGHQSGNDPKGNQSSAPRTSAELDGDRALSSPSPVHGSAVRHIHNLTPQGPRWSARGCVSVECGAEVEFGELGTAVGEGCGAPRQLIGSPGMCGGPMATGLRSETPPKIMAPDTIKRAARGSLGGWQPQLLPASSGCDSSDCAYCQVLARMRRPGSSTPDAAGGCWLRRKRSRTDLASMADEAPSSSTGDADPGSENGGGLPAAAGVPPLEPPLPQGSIWDHALLVEEPAANSTVVGETAAGGAGWWASCQVQRLGASPDDGGLGSGGARSRRRSSSSLGALAVETDDSSSDGGGTNAAWGGSGAATPLSGGEGGWHPSWRSPASLHEVAAFVPPEPYRHRQDIVCALEFEEHGWLLASAGVSKQVRVYSLASCLQHPDETAYREPLRCHRMASKLSSLAWNPDAPGVVTVADYDGVVTQLDLESGHLIAEADEHCGRRVWSVSHSLQRPHLCASASDDGTVRLWGGAGMQACLAALRPARGVPATGVHLSQFDANLAAVACADHSAYVYDLRWTDQPLLQLLGHDRAVSYVRWLGPGRLVTASTDASLAVWQLPGAQQAGDATAGLDVDAAEPMSPKELLHPGTSSSGSGGGSGSVLHQPWKRLRGHSNGKNFVGLSVRPEDCLVACGSEAPACFAYHDSWSNPLAVHSFGPLQLPASLAAASAHPAAKGQPLADQFCSAVSWQPATARLGGAPMLAAAASSGDLRVLELRRPPANAAARRCTDG